METKLHQLTGGGITVHFNDWEENEDAIILFYCGNAMKVATAILWKTDKGAKSRINEIKKMMPK